MNWCQVFLCTCVIACVRQFTWVACQSQERFILKSLADHGDRISDLEGVVNALKAELKAEYGGLLTEVTVLRQENKQLKSQIQNLTALCNSTQCCQSCPRNNTGQTGSYASTTKQTDTGYSSPALTMSVPTNTAVTTTLPSQTTRPKATTASVETSTVSTRSTVPTQSTTHGITSGYMTSLPVTSSTAQTTTPTVYDDCVSATWHGLSQGGIVKIKQGTTGKTVRAVCDDDGWLVIQRRQDGSQDFNQNWDTYKKGFGDLDGEFWLGNDNIHYITSSGDYTLRIDMEDWAQNKKYEEYQHFRIENEIRYYKLFVGSVSGTAGDSFHYGKSNLLAHFQMPFSTPDRDNDRSSLNCAQTLKSGWWFNACYSSNLNGRYLHHPYGRRLQGEMSGQPTLEGTGIEWYPLKQHQYSLKRVEMKIKPGASAIVMG